MKLTSELTQAYKRSNKHSPFVRRREKTFGSTWTDGYLNDSTSDNPNLPALLAVLQGCQQYARKY
jgi:hypothetical protein